MCFIFLIPVSPFFLFFVVVVVVEVVVEVESYLPSITGGGGLEIHFQDRSLNR